MIRRVILAAFLTCWPPLIAGCSSRIGVDPKLVQRGQVQAGKDQLAHQTSAATGDEGTAVNISPAVAIYGGGGLLIFVLLIVAAVMVRAFLRLRCGFGVLAWSIESCGNRQIKSQVTKKSLQLGIGDLIHRQVRRHVG